MVAHLTGCVTISIWGSKGKIDMSTSIWIKPSGVEVTVDSGSYEAAASLGWKPKADPAPDDAEKRRGRPPKFKGA